MISGKAILSLESRICLMRSLKVWYNGDRVSSAMVAAFFALTHSIARALSTSSSQTKGSSAAGGGADDDCCASRTGVRQEKTSRARTLTAARCVGFMRAPGWNVPDVALKYEPLRGSRIGRLLAPQRLI